jgi:hypothetical protein
VVPTNNRMVVEEFLDKVARALDGNGSLIIVDRRKYREAVADFNISPSDVKETIRHLTCDHYYRGPRTDNDNHKALICEFGVSVDEIEVYIKLKLAELGGAVFCTCISFHRAEAPLQYPLRGGENND